LDPEPSIITAGVIAFLLLLGFTSAVEAAFMNVSRHRLSTLLAGGTARARVLTGLIDDPYRFRATILILQVTSTIGAVACTLYLSDRFGLWVQIGSLALLFLAILIFSESIPKALVLRSPEAMATLLARPLSLISFLLWPILALFQLITRPLMRFISGKEKLASPLVTEEELRMLMNAGQEEGLIEQEERDMIKGVFSVSDTLVREVMVPRVDIASLDVESSFADALDIVLKQGHSRIPVYRDSMDTIVGVLYARDLMEAVHRHKTDTRIEELVRPAYFVPETLKVGALLRDLQRRKVHIALIVDEYGGTAGLVTIEDLLEEIVGDIQDEYDLEERSIRQINDNELLAYDRVPISDINEVTGLALEAEDADRIGGFVYEQLGRVPVVGDIVEVDGATIEVVAVQGVRPELVRIMYQGPQQIDLGVQEREYEHVGAT
jgi:putative hemolysin